MQMVHDFIYEHGVPRMTSRGREVLAALSELIVSFVTDVEDTIDKRSMNASAMNASEGMYCGPKDAFAFATLNLCLAYLFPPLRAHYGAEQASIALDCLFARCSGRLPQTEELYIHYLGFPLLRSDPDQEQRNPKPSLCVYFAQHLVGSDDLVVVSLLMAFTNELMIAAMDILRAGDPLEQGKERAGLLIPHVTATLRALNASL
jgi:hypothetical protein